MLAPLRTAAAAAAMLSTAHTKNTENLLTQHLLKYCTIFVVVLILLHLVSAWLFIIYKTVHISTA